MPDPARRLDADAVALLQELIRNRCVNDGSPDSGNEIASVRTLQRFFGPELLGRADVTAEIVESRPGRGSLIVRIRGRVANAPATLLLGHLDVVPVGDDTWRHDPFAAELIDGEIWGRGAVDMLTLTSAMAVVARLAIEPEHRPAGELVFAAVADEESGGTWGTRWLVERRPDLLAADYALTEQGGVLLDRNRFEHPGITLGVGEKGSAPRRLEITGISGHGSVPHAARSAAVLAAEVLLQLTRHPAPPVILPHWVSLVQALSLPTDLESRLLSPETLDDALPELGGLAPLGHALTRMTISPNIVRAGSKRNVIPGTATVDLDIRVLPGQTTDDVDRFLSTAIAPWADSVRVTGIEFQPGSLTSPDTPLYTRIAEVMRRRYPGAVAANVIGPGGSDGRFLRPLGTRVYGFGLFSRSMDVAKFRRRLHARDERIDVESVHLTTRGLADVVLGTDWVEPESVAQ